MTNLATQIVALVRDHQRSVETDKILAGDCSYTLCRDHLDRVIKIEFPNLDFAITRNEQDDRHPYAVWECVVEPSEETLVLLRLTLL